jgi:hypothetical protein
MKLVAIILSLITFTLSAIPCDDNATVNSEQSTSISQDSSHTNHSGYDLCSPFCSCVCCATIVLEPIIYQSILNSEIPVKELNTIYIVSFSNKFLSLIYQPPQV